MSGGYTAVPSPELDALLDSVLAEIARELDRSRPAGLAAVVLGGGYGRGEGGVLHTAAGDRLYNDLDFFVFADGAGRRERRRIDARLREIGEALEPRLGIAVDFSPAKNLSSLVKVSRTLMFQELLHGWKPVWGAADPVRRIPGLDPSELPYTEAVRLLLNRGMGLVFAGERLARGEADADFIVRNMNKAVLGCGDALLLAGGKYRWRGAERVAAVAGSAESSGMPAGFADAYAEAFRRKLEPEPVLPADPAGRWRECRGFYLAAVRLVAGADAGAGSGEVASGLRRKAADARSLKHFFRWLIRARGVRPAGALAEDPVVTVLIVLYGLLSEAAELPACPRGLYDLWLRFN